ncbi:hypothetical protein MRB53_040705 [Persea americana]|nr:hypothetical protein MRB53_040705 [Persea americana]
MTEVSYLRLEIRCDGGNSNREKSAEDADSQGKQDEYISLSQHAAVQSLEHGNHEKFGSECGSDNAEPHKALFKPWHLKGRTNDEKQQDQSGAAEDGFKCGSAQVMSGRSRLVVFKERPTAAKERGSSGAAPALISYLAMTSPPP